MSLQLVGNPKNVLRPQKVAGEAIGHHQAADERGGGASQPSGHWDAVGQAKTKRGGRTTDDVKVTNDGSRDEVRTVARKRLGPFASNLNPERSVGDEGDVVVEIDRETKG